MGLNILIVDDSPIMRSMIKRILNLSGLDIGEMRFAGNGDEGLTVMHAHWLDLVIADLNMPVMDGFEMISRMRGDEVLRNIPVIVVSTEGSGTKIEKLRGMGVTGIVHKPFSPEEILKAVNEVVYEAANES
jgi:two-component system chemotaxis response regulator CheY